MIKSITLLSLGIASSIAINAASPVRKDTTNLKNVSAPISTRAGYDVSPGRLASPNANSIWVDRDASIHNYTPEELVKNILLNSHSEADKARIKNVEHIGWNWNGSAWTHSTPTPFKLGVGTYGVWGEAATAGPYDANERSLAYFSNGDRAGFQIDSGLIMGTGPIMMAEGPNVTNHGLSDGVKNDGTQGMHTYNSTLDGLFSGSGSMNPSSYSSISHDGGWFKHKPNTPWNPTTSFDRDLDALTADSILWSTCGSVLEFDFQPAISQATFDYVFASDEYPEGCYSANDVFGFFVSGPFDSPSGKDIEAATDWSVRNPIPDGDKEHTRSSNDSVYYRYNIARLPDNNPVGIDYINWGIPNNLYNYLMTGSTPEYNKTGNFTIGSHTTGAPREYVYFDPTTGTPPGGWTYYYPFSGGDPTPGTATAVGAHSGSTYYGVPTNPDLFRYNHIDSSMMEYDGYTVKLQAKADKLVPGKWYHLKLAISQTVQRNSPTVYYVDDNHGSGVFLANLDLGTLESKIDDPYDDFTFDDDGLDEDGIPFYYDGGEGSRCNGYKISFKFDSVAATNNSTVLLSFENIDPDKIATIEVDDKTGDTTYVRIFSKADTIQLNGISDTIRKFENVVFLTDYPEFVNGQYVKIISTIPGGNSDTLYFPLFNHVSWGPIMYTPITETNKGRLSLGLKGGSNKLMLSVDGGLTYRYARDENGKELPYSSWELLELSNDVPMPIILREPRSCWKYDTVWVGGSGADIVIQRYIDIPKVDGMTTIPNAGKHYVEGHQDFSFTASFGGPSLKLMAEGYYSGTILNLDSLAEIQPDGSLKYTIKKVVEPWRVYVSEGTTNGETSNEAILTQSVWTSGNTLYINSEKYCTAKVYSLTGMLYKQIEVNGSTSVQLSRGFYIVSINDQQYKVVIK